MLPEIFNESEKYVRVALWCQWRCPDPAAHPCSAGSRPTKRSWMTNISVMYNSLIKPTAQELLVGQAPLLEWGPPPLLSFFPIEVHMSHVTCPCPCQEVSKYMSHYVLVFLSLQVSLQCSGCQGKPSDSLVDLRSSMCRWSTLQEECVCVDIYKIYHICQERSGAFC